METVVDNADKQQTLQRLERQYWFWFENCPGGVHMRKARLEWLEAVQQMQLGVQLSQGN